MQSNGGVTAQCMEQTFHRRLLFMDLSLEMQEQQLSEMSSRGSLASSCAHMRNLSNVLCTMDV